MFRMLTARFENQYNIARLSVCTFANNSYMKIVLSYLVYQNQFIPSIYVVKLMLHIRKLGN